MFSAACTQEGQHAGRCVEALGSSRFLQHISIFLCLSASSHPICSLRTWEKRSTFGLFTEWRAQSEIVSKKLGWCYICENTIRKKEEKKNQKNPTVVRNFFFPSQKVFLNASKQLITIERARITWCLVFFSPTFFLMLHFFSQKDLST